MPERGGRTARHDTSRAVLNLIGLVCLPDKPAERLATVLLPTRVGKIWRVQIVWPNGSVHYFGEFPAKQDAVDWIAAHAWLTVRPNRPGDVAE